MKDSFDKAERLKLIHMRRLGIQLARARHFAQLTIKECAEEIGVNESQYEDYETGRQSPSLPEIEVLAGIFQTTVEALVKGIDRFEEAVRIQSEKKRQLLIIRQKTLGASLRLARKNKNLSLEEMAAAIQSGAGEIADWEEGKKSISLIELEKVTEVLEIKLQDLFPHHMRVEESPQSGDFEKQSHFDAKERQFLFQPDSKLFIDLSLAISQIPKPHLRSVAEALLLATK